jgi:hypothetical protein
MNTSTSDFADDYALLGAPAACALEQLRLHYRRAVREVHPDLHPALANDVGAQDRLRALNAAMARLEDHHQQHGRLPLEPLRLATPPMMQAPAHPAGTAGGAENGALRAGGIKWLLVSATFALGIWALAPEPAKPPPPVEEPRAAPISNEAAMRAAAAARAARGLEFGVRIGDDRHRVKAILGAPILVTGDVWEYGPSHVVFRDGHVVDWYSSPLKPISVDESSRMQIGDR